MVQAEIDEISHEKWGNCVKVSSGTIEIIATLDFGPRIIRFGAVGGENEFYEDIEGLINKDGESAFDIFGDEGFWNIYGGHRLWAAPEEYPRTYYPDNEPVNYISIENGIKLTPLPQAWTELQMEMEIVFKNEFQVEVTHKITNTGAWDAEFAPWALTVMPVGGLEVIPQPKKDTGLLGNRILALWPYSGMADERVKWGDDYITLCPASEINKPFKLGINNEHGFMAYFNHGNLFVKRYAPVDGGSYPDGGVSCETYTNNVMVELETLGELKKVKPNETVSHIENWELVLGVPKPRNDEEIDLAVKKYILK